MSRARIEKVKLERVTRVTDATLTHRERES
jgi:hypothetical protein